jgi:hypothetical protein
MALVALFMVNPAGRVCLARYDVAAGDPDIARVAYLPASRIAAVMLADGDERILVDEINDDIHPALIANPDILIVHMDDAGQPVREYMVALDKR